MDTNFLRQFISSLSEVDKPLAARLVSLAAFGKDPANESALLAVEVNTRGGTPYHDGRTDDAQFYERVWKDYPNAPIAFLLRNFTLVECMPIPQILVPGIGWDRVYTSSACDYSKFAPELGAFIAGGVGEQNTISIGWWLKNAQKMADLIGRTVHITHQYGSGDPSDAEFDNYGFVPEGRDWKGQLIDWFIFEREEGSAS
jgi:hypothetical protein